MDLGNESFYQASEDDKIKSLPRGHSFSPRQLKKRKRGQTLVTSAFEIKAHEIMVINRVLGRWKQKRDSRPKSLTDCESKLMSRIVQKHFDSNPSEREPLLHMAVRTGSTAIVENVLEEEPNTTLRSPKGQTALHVAAESDFPEIAALLLHYDEDKKKAFRFARMISVAGQESSNATSDNDDLYVEEQREIAIQKLNGPQREGGGGGGGGGEEKGILQDCPELLSSVNYPSDVKLLLCRDQNLFTPFSTAALKGSRSVLDVLFQHARKRKIHCTMWKDILHMADLTQSSLLHLAVRSGHLPVVRMCLEKGVRLKHCMLCGDTPLHLAAQLGFVGIVRHLVSVDEDIVHMKNNKGRTPLHEASKADLPEVVELLLSKGAAIDSKDREGNTPVLLAAHHGCTKTVRLLINSGANLMVVNATGCSVVHQAVGHIETMEFVLEGKNISQDFLNLKDATDSDTALHYAATGGYFRNVVQLLSCGANPNSRNLKKRIPLHMAAENGWLHSAQHLIAYSRIQKSINATDYKGKTPLHRAAANGKFRLVVALIEKGACILRDAQECTPLHYAAAQGSAESCRAILITEKCCCDDRDKSGNTALHYAALSNQPDTVRFLLDAQVRVLMNHANQNPLDVAMHCGAKRAAIAFAEHSRWEALLRERVKQPVVDVKKRKVMRMEVETKSQIQWMVEKMPDVALKFMDRCCREEDNTKTFDFRFLQGYSGDVRDSLTAFRTMQKLRVKRCLAHPVSCALLNVKWLSFGWWLYGLYLLAMLVYVIFLSTYVVLAHPSNWPKSKNSSDNISQSPFRVVQVLLIVSASVLCMLTLERIVGSIVGRRFESYFRGLGRLDALTLPGNILAFVFILPIKDIGDDHNWVVGAIAIFISWTSLTMYLKRLPYIGILMVMVTKMAKRFFQVSVVLLFLILGFSFAFYTLLASSHLEFPAYSNFESSPLKVFTMMIGEVDFNELFLPNSSNPNDHEVLSDSTRIWLSLLYLIFVIFMGILVMNLLIALAVGDVESVWERSTIEGYIMQVDLHVDLEQSLPNCFLRKFWVDSVTVDLSKRKNWISFLRQKMTINVSRKKNGKALPENDQENLAPVLETLSDRLTYQDQRINDIRSKVDKLVSALLPTEKEPEWERAHPLTFKEAAKKTLARVQQNKAIRRRFRALNRFSAGTEKADEKEQEADENSEPIVRYENSEYLVEETTV